MSCTCRPGELPSTSCPKHGLYGDVRFPPMDRHAKVVEVPSTGCNSACRHAPPTRRETAAEAQRRLYLEAASDRVRVEAAGFRWPLRQLPARGIGQR